MNLMTNTVLEVNELSIAFGGLIALDKVTISVGEKELVGLIGPNGAGKTTLFNTITGLSKQMEGEIIFKTKKISQLPPHERTQCGISRTFQNIRLFPELSVLDNVRIAADMHHRPAIMKSIFRTAEALSRESEALKKAESLLEIMNLSKIKNEKAKNLPYGDQRKLEIARAIAIEPDLLLLDEPAAGMHPGESRDLMNLISWLRDQFNLAILLIEHDMKVVMGVCERIYVLDYGKVIAEGDPDYIKNNPKVIEAYLGEPDVASS